jgi:hypothetical protein
MASRNSSYSMQQCGTSHREGSQRLLERIPLAVIAVRQEPRTERAEVMEIGYCCSVYIRKLNNETLSWWAAEFEGVGERWRRGGGSAGEGEGSLAKDLHVVAPDALSLQSGTARTYWLCFITLYFPFSTCQAT